MFWHGQIKSDNCMSHIMFEKYFVHFSKRRWLRHNWSSNRSEQRYCVNIFCSFLLFSGTNVIIIINTFCTLYLRNYFMSELEIIMMIAFRRLFSAQEMYCLIRLCIVLKSTCLLCITLTSLLLNVVYQRFNDFYVLCFRVHRGQ